MFFHTNADSGADDLKGNSLDDLVCVLRDVELLVIDEISTVGAASFELISRRLEQGCGWSALVGHRQCRTILVGLGESESF